MNNIENTRRKIFRLIAVFLIIILSLGLFGCKKKTTEENNPQGIQETVQSEGQDEGQGLDSNEDAADESKEKPSSENDDSYIAESNDYPDEDGYYYTKDEVALYIHVYGHLPDNYMTKKDAKKLGWSGGSLEKFAPGMVIGGDRFGNYEGSLPDGKKYTECDIDTYKKKKRGAKRIVFSDDGYIYYTEDHYDTFELLYEPGDD